jgi:PE family protein
VSLVTAVPEFMAAAAQDLSGVGSTIEAAGVAAAAPTTAVLPPAADDISAELANLFCAHGQSYQAASAQASGFHQDFGRAFRTAGTSYAQAEALNASPLQSLKGLAGVAEKAPARLFGHQGAARAGLHLAQGARGSSISLVSRTGGLKATPGNIFGASAGQSHFPFFRQIVSNQVGYWKTLITALNSGNLHNITSALQAVCAQMEENLVAVVKQLTDFSWSLTKPGVLKPLTLLLGTPIALALDLIGAPVNAFQALEHSVATFVQAVESGNPSGALSALLKAPGDIAKAFLYGETMLDISLPIQIAPVLQSMEIDIPLGGLLAPLRSVQMVVNGKPTILAGTQIGGFVPGLAQVGQELAGLITPAAAYVPEMGSPALDLGPARYLPYRLAKDIDAVA